MIHTLKQDYRDELGFTDVLVAVVNVRYRCTSRPISSRGKSKVSRQSMHPTPTSKAVPGARGLRRVLRVAVFSEDNPFRVPTEKVGPLLQCPEAAEG